MSDSNVKFALSSGTILHGRKYSYRIEKVLGQGSFGITYLASTMIEGPLGEIEVQVTVKEFFARDLNSRKGDGTVISASDGSLADKYGHAFQKESLNLSKMKHPGIVKVLEAFEANGTYYYTMEFISGGSLDQKVKGVGIPEKDALPLIEKVGAAISYMHSRNVMHLDLKPKNIMLRNNGDPVVIDFGLSKQFNSDGEPESSSSIGMGTPGYAPLEQANQTAERVFQPSMDIYALGATLYKMLTGETPPVASEILNNTFPEEKLRKKDVSQSTITAIKEAMAPVKRDRPSSINGFLNLLNGASSSEDQDEERTDPKYNLKKGVSVANQSNGEGVDDSDWINKKQSGSLSLDSNPSDANFCIDGVIVEDPTPLKIDNLKVGGHTVTFKEQLIDGQKYSGEASFNITKGKTTKLIVELDNLNVGSDKVIPFPDKKPNKKAEAGSSSKLKKTLLYSLLGLAALVLLVLFIRSITPAPIVEYDAMEVVEEDTLFSEAEESPQTEHLPSGISNVDPNPAIESKKVWTMKVTSSPSGADIYLDGNHIGNKTPHILENLDPGIHTLVLKKDGFEEASEKLRIVEGRNDEVSIVLKELKKSDPESAAPASNSQIAMSSHDQDISSSTQPDSGQNTSSPVTSESKTDSAKPSTTIVNGHQAVDLGLSVKWATSNLENRFGEDFFAWGAVDTQLSYTWSSYKFYRGEKSKLALFSKYTIWKKNDNVDGKTQLEEVDDAARILWGKGWRIPTSGEFKELLDNCDWVWTEVDRRKGYKITGKNGNSIFLPASGMKMENYQVYGFDEEGSYWTSTLADSQSNGRTMEFTERWKGLSATSRKTGLTIRPVAQ